MDRIRCTLCEKQFPREELVVCLDHPIHHPTAVCVACARVGSKLRTSP
jgi:hypothetical protein